METIRHYMHFAQRNPENSLIKLNNRGSVAVAGIPDRFRWRHGDRNKRG
jgi:hypothetical protein